MGGLSVTSEIQRNYMHLPLRDGIACTYDHFLDTSTPVHNFVTLIYLYIFISFYLPSDGRHNFSPTFPEFFLSSSIKIPGHELKLGYGKFHMLSNSLFTNVYHSSLYNQSYWQNY